MLLAVDSARLYDLMEVTDFLKTECEVLTMIVLYSAVIRRN